MLVGFETGRVDLEEGKEVEITGKDKLVMDGVENDAKVDVKATLGVWFKAVSGDNVGIQKGKEDEEGEEKETEQDDGREDELSEEREGRKRK